MMEKLITIFLTDEHLKGWKDEHPFKYAKGEHITSQEAVDVLYQESKGDAIITTELDSIVGCPVLQVQGTKNLHFIAWTRYNGVWLSRRRWS